MNDTVLLVSFDESVNDLKPAVSEFDHADFREALQCFIQALRDFHRAYTFLLSPHADDSDDKVMTEGVSGPSDGGSDAQDLPEEGGTQGETDEEREKEAASLTEGLKKDGCAE